MLLIPALGSQRRVAALWVGGHLGLQWVAAQPGLCREILSPKYQNKFVRSQNYPYLCLQIESSCFLLRGYQVGKGTSGFLRGQLPSSGRSQLRRSSPVSLPCVVAPEGPIGDFRCRRMHSLPPHCPQFKAQDHRKPAVPTAIKVKRLISKLLFHRPGKALPRFPEQLHSCGSESRHMAYGVRICTWEGTSGEGLWTGNTPS